MDARIIQAGLVVVFGSAMFIGGYSAHPSVQTKDKVEEHSKATEVAKNSATTIRDESKAVAKNVETDTTTTKFPDGRITVVERVVDRTKIEAKSAETKIVIQERIKTVEVVKVETHEKLTLRRPDWLLGVQAGASVPGLLFGRPLEASVIPGLPRALTVSLSLERRLFAGVYGGLRVDSRGTVMAGLTVSF